MMMIAMLSAAASAVQKSAGIDEVSWLQGCWEMTSGQSPAVFMSKELTGRYLLPMTA